MAGDIRREMRNPGGMDDGTLTLDDDQRWMTASAVKLKVGATPHLGLLTGVYLARTIDKPGRGSPSASGSYAGNMLLYL